MNELRIYLKVYRFKQIVETLLLFNLIYKLEKLIVFIGTHCNKYLKYI